MTTFCLGFMCLNDERWLRLHLPVYLASGALDGVVALDGGSSDGTVDYLLSQRVTVIIRKWDDHFARQANALVQACEGAGYDLLYRMDPDELVFGADLWRIRHMLEDQRADMVAVSRYHFIGDRLHWRPSWSPDSQWRAWRLGMGIRYPTDQAVHETPSHVARMKHIEDAWCFHYGWLLSAPERAYRTAYYEALKTGGALPNREDYADRVMDIPCEPFIGRQPLDPAIIGARAPFELEQA